MAENVDGHHNLSHYIALTCVSGTSAEHNIIEVMGQLKEKKLKGRAWIPVSYSVPCQKHEGMTETENVSCSVPQIFFFQSVLAASDKNEQNMFHLPSPTYLIPTACFLSLLWNGP